MVENLTWKFHSQHQGNIKATSLCDQSVEVDSQTAASWCSAASAANGLAPLDQHQSLGNGSACFPLCHVFFHLLNRLNRLLVKRFD